MQVAVKKQNSSATERICQSHGESLASTVPGRADATAESLKRVNHITRQIGIVGLVGALLLGPQIEDQLLRSFLSSFTINHG